MNAGQHYWKACWGQPLRSSNLLSSATSDQGEHRSPVSAGCGFRARWSHLLVSVLTAQHHSHRDSPQLFCQVTGVADGPEQRAARRRSVRLTVQGWPGPFATSRIPASYIPHHSDEGSEPPATWRMLEVAKHPSPPGNREAPMETAYDGRQVVGMDLHRRCSCGRCPAQRRGATWPTSRPPPAMSPGPAVRVWPARRAARGGSLCRAWRISCAGAIRPCGRTGTAGRRSPCWCGRRGLAARSAPPAA